MLIRALSIMAGPFGTARPGETIDVPDSIAKALIDAESAELVPTVAEAAAGAAEREAPENPSAAPEPAAASESSVPLKTSRRRRGPVAAAESAEA